MPGIPGSGGPVPKSSNQRRRRNKPDVATTELARGEATAGSVPNADEAWHPRAREWYDSLARSGQSELYEPSDWAMAKLAADLMTTICSADRPSAQMVASLLQLTTALMVTEGDRRRHRLELARGPRIDEDEEASVTAMADYQRRLKPGG